MTWSEIRRRAIAALVMLGAMGAQPADAATIAAYNPAVHDRYTIWRPTYPATNVLNSSFIGGFYDFSGVGYGDINNAQQGGSVFRAATLITPQHYVTANHFHFDPGDKVNFTNAAGELKTYIVEQEVAIGGDLRLGRLTQAIAPSDQIATYPIFEFAVGAGVTANWLVGKTVMVHARGGTNPTVSAPRVALGMISRIDVSQIAQITGLTLDGGPFSDHRLTGLHSGDSSDPTFMVWRNQLVVVGTHSSGITSLSDMLVSSMLTPIQQQLMLWGDTERVTKMRIDNPNEPVFLDYNGNGMLGAGDIDRMMTVINGGSYDLLYDLNRDGALTLADADVFIRKVLRTCTGDLNLDGVVNMADLTVLAMNFGTMSGSTWATGDINGDGATTIADFSALATQFGHPISGSITAPLVPVTFPPLSLTFTPPSTNGDGESIPLPGAAACLLMLLPAWRARRRRSTYRGPGRVDTLVA